MITFFILACVAVCFFIAYNSVMLGMFGIPYSLSGTYYYLNNKKQGAGIWFSVFMIVTFLTLMTPWMFLSTQISTLSGYFTILPFITCACMCYVGIAPNIRSSKRIEQIHVISAAVGAASALLWVCIVCWKIAYVFPLWVLLCGGIAHLTNTAKTARDYWLEMAAFGTTITAIITEYIMLLC